MSNINELAKELNKHKNKNRLGPCVGEVVELNPVRISIAGGNVLLTEGDELNLCEKLKTHKVTADITWINGEFTGSFHGTTTGGDGVSGTVTGPASADITSAEITLKPNLKVSDLVYVIPMEGEQTWIGVDRVG